ncbi:hypothetical protein BU26DRAFT_503162 [Trematosphaeria pertusa]|uniref:Uncharacterized protein n=1 Tax=Trematosphaeria pertusa TaxID=390896 RepID=A0A6A6IIT6_9PLEO|nr:uncharacterized protein BU26DRAFT_503162 [Trematosphaeria pertusa]KAF2250484.1 hypothetical protein BU26DRAFT_503162 [Trematosphaeria pertusa]
MAPPDHPPDNNRGRTVDGGLGVTEPTADIAAAALLSKKAASAPSREARNKWYCSVLEMGPAAGPPSDNGRLSCTPRDESDSACRHCQPRKLTHRAAITGSMVDRVVSLLCRTTATPPSGMRQPATAGGSAGMAPSLSIRVFCSLALPCAHTPKHRQRRWSTSRHTAKPAAAAFCFECAQSRAEALATGVARLAISALGANGHPDGDPACSALASKWSPGKASRGWERLAAPKANPGDARATDHFPPSDSPKHEILTASRALAQSPASVTRNKPPCGDHDSRAGASPTPCCCTLTHRGRRRPLPFPAQPAYAGGNATDNQPTKPAHRLSAREELRLCLPRDKEETLQPVASPWWSRRYSASAVLRRMQAPAMRDGRHKV